VLHVGLAGERETDTELLADDLDDLGHSGLASAADTRKAALEGVSVTVKANASPEGKLFGSVGPRDIAEAFSANGHPLEKSEVVMGEGAIRHTGEFDIHVHLHADVHTTVKVTVVAED